MMETCLKHAEALKGGLRIGDHEPLIPLDDLRAIIVELSAALRPNANPGEFIAQLIGAYPKFQPTKEWRDHAHGLFRSVPADLAPVAVRRISEQHGFPPSNAQMHKIAMELVNRRRARLERARAMIAEHQRRQHEADRRKAAHAFREKLDGRSPLSLINGGKT